MNEFYSSLKFFLSEFFFNTSLGVIITNRFIRELLLFSIFLIIFSSIYLLCKKFLLKFLKQQLINIFSSDKNSNLFIKNGIFEKCLFFLYTYILYTSATNFPIPIFIAKIFFLFVAISSCQAFYSLLNFIDRLYANRLKKTPIKGYLQLAKIAFLLVIIIITLAVFLDKSPRILLGGLGALTAVILLIFRDTILSLVASIQILSNRLIAKGDWVSLPTFQVDGEVIDITLHQMIVQNWDKSLSVIPIHLLANNSFKNWKNMLKEGRRIAKSFWLNQETVIFLSGNKLVKIEELLKEKMPVYQDNPKTNLYYFRQYIYNYLKKHSAINEESTLLVRNLNSTIDGVEVQIYAFCRETDWAIYEQIQSEIIEHLLAIAQVFDLEIFQRKI